MAKSKNRLAKASASVNPFRHPSDMKMLAKIPKGVQVPSETMEIMGYLTSFVQYYRAHPKSAYHKAAMLVDCISYDESTSGSTRSLGWISIHFKSSVRMSSKRATFRNAIERAVVYSNKPYGWSGFINKSIVPGCDSRISLGPRTKIYGTYGPTYSNGTSYIQKLISKFK